MRDTELCSVTEDEFRIWVQIRFVDLHDTSTAYIEKLCADIRCFIEKRYHKCQQVTMPIRKSLMNMILERFSFQPSTHNESVAQALSRFESSISISSTSRGIVFDISKIATLEALSFPEDDETTWTALFQSIVNSVVSPCLRDANKNDFTTCSEAERWGRPLWVWTWHDRLYAQATLLILELMKQIAFQTTVTISDSDDEFLSIPTLSDRIHRHHIFVIYNGRTSSKSWECKMQFEGSHLNEGLTDDAVDDSETQFELEMNQTPLGEPSFEVDHRQAYVSKENPESPHACHEDAALCFESQASDGMNFRKFPTICLDDAPDGSTPTCGNKAPIVTPSQKESPQFDSLGVDMSILSQLPPKVRAEARLALAIQGRGRRHYKMKNGLMKWFTPHTFQEPIRSNKTVKIKPKKKLLIQDFLVKKENYGPNHIS
jgi:hypothetical protein